MATQFKPIDGQEIAAGSAVTVFTAGADNTIVTSFQVVAPTGFAGGDVTVYRIPNGGSAVAANIVAQKAAMAAGDRIDLKNLFLDNGDTIRVLTAVSGPVASGNYSTP